MACLTYHRILSSAAPLNWREGVFPIASLKVINAKTYYSMPSASSSSSSTIPTLAYADKECHDFAVVVSLLAGSTALDTSTPAVRVPVAPGRRAQYHFLVPNLVRRWVVLSPPGLVHP